MPPYGAVIGAAIGYLQGGGYKTSLKSVNWDDAEAKRRATSYGIAGAEIGIAIYGTYYSIKGIINIQSGNFGWQGDLFRYIGAKTGSAFLGGATLFVINTLIIGSIVDWAVDKIKEDLKKRVHN